MEREELHLIFVEVAYSTGARSPSSSEEPPADVSDDRTNSKVYYEMSKEEAPDSSPYNDLTAGTKLRRYIPKPERNRDVQGLRVIESVNDGFVAVADSETTTC